MGGESEAEALGAEALGAERPLAGIGVLECGDSVAGAYAGRQLCDLAAEVVKAERPEGDPLRANRPVGGGPTDLTMSLPEVTAGLHAAAATLAALPRYRATGRAVRVECSMLEAFMVAFTWQAVFGALTGGDAPVMGNRDELRSPHEVFPCRGEDRYVAIAVGHDQQFRALAAVLGGPELGDDPRFRTLADRRLRESVLEPLVAAWTSQCAVDDAVAALERAGVPAAKVCRVDEVRRLAAEGVAR